MKKSLKNKTNYTLITTAKDLNSYTDYLLTFIKLLAVDTETYIDESKLNPSALDPHSSRISLIQVNFIGGIPTIIDVLKIGANKCLYFIENIMMNSEIIKVFHNACVPKTTDILTPEGWVNILDIKSGDTVMGYKDGEQQWTKVINFVDAGVQDLYATFDSRRSIISTKNHRHLCQRLTGRKRDGKKELYLTTEELATVKCKPILSIINSAPAKLTKDLFSEDELRLLGWIWGDGCISKTKHSNGKTYYQCSITQSSKNYDYTKDIEALLTRLNILGSVYKLPTHPYIYRYNIPVNFVRELYSRLSLELDSKDYSAFILNSSTKSIIAFCDAFYKAEGAKARKHYYCQTLKVNKEKSDCIALAGHLLGYTPYQSKEYVSFNKPTTGLRKLNNTLVSRENTYCINTETSNFVMRQNGFITITGNCFDIKQFKSTFNVWIKNIECTKVFMQSLGINTGMKASLFRGHALKDLARDYFDCDMDKTEGASQWGARPLSDSQLKYAALDVGCPEENVLGKLPAGYKNNCLLLTARNLFRDQLISIGQEYCMTADQQAMYISSKLEYEGMYVDKELLHNAYLYAEKETNKYRKAVVEELGFTIYSSLDLNEEGEWEEIEVIPDKIKTLLNNNKGLVTYINQHLRDRGEKGLDSLQADEVKTYLDTLESDTELEKEEGLLSTGDIEDRYQSIGLIKNLLKYKKHSKLLTECRKYKRVINPNTNRVHAGFSSVGTSTGRMSSSGAVNLQQVSSTAVVVDLPRNKM